MQNNQDLNQISEPQEENSSGTKKNKKWTIQEDNILQQLVAQFGEKNWRQISNQMLNRTPIQCLHRWTKILKPGLVKGPWSQEEDEKLLEWVKSNGPQKWSLCSETITGRSGKQCRERWFNNLNPNVKKGNWTQQEDDIIFKGYLTHGSSWSKIAKDLEGRTENSVKNRFYSTVRKLFLDSSMSQSKNQKEGSDGKNVEEQPDKLRQFLQNHLMHNNDKNGDEKQDQQQQKQKQKQEQKQQKQSQDEMEEESEEKDQNKQEQQQEKQKQTEEDKKKQQQQSPLKKTNQNQEQKQQTQSDNQEQNKSEENQDKQNKDINEVIEKELNDNKENIKDTDNQDKEKQEIQKEEQKNNQNEDKIEIEKEKEDKNDNNDQNDKEQEIQVEKNQKEKIEDEDNNNKTTSQDDNKQDSENITQQQQNGNSNNNDQEQEQNEDESDQSNVMKRKYSKVQEDYSQQNLLYRLLKEKHIPIKKTSCMKDYSVFYRKYKQNKNISKRKQKENEKLSNLKKLIEQNYGKNGNQQQLIKQNDDNNDLIQDINQQNSLFMQDLKQYDMNKMPNNLQEQQKQLNYFRLDRETENQLTQFFNDQMLEMNKKFQQQFITPILQKQQQLLLTNSDSQQLIRLQQQEQAMYNYMNMHFQTYNQFMMRQQLIQPMQQHNLFYPQPMPAIDTNNFNQKNNQQNMNTKLEDISSSDDFLNNKNKIQSQKNSLYDFPLKQEFFDSNSSKSALSKNKKLIKPKVSKEKQQFQEQQQQQQQQIQQQEQLNQLQSQENIFGVNTFQKDNLSNFSFDHENNPLNPHKNSTKPSQQSFMKTKKTQQLLQKQGLLQNFEKYGEIYNQLNELKKEKEKQGNGFTQENDQKILYLLSQLNSLEGMLNNTKSELSKLEVSIQNPTPENMSQSSAPNISHSLAILAGKSQNNNNFMSLDQKSIPVSNPGMPPLSFTGGNKDILRKNSGTYSDFDKFINRTNE